MVVAQADVWWAELPDPIGSEPGFRRPIIVVQGDALNRSRLETTVCVPLTSNTRWADAPGNVFLGTGETNLPRDGVAMVSQLVTIDKCLLVDRVGRIPRRKLELVLTGIDVVLGR